MNGKFYNVTLIRNNVNKRERRLIYDLNIASSNTEDHIMDANNLFQSRLEPEECKIWRNHFSTRTLTLLRSHVDDLQCFWMLQKIIPNDLILIIREYSRCDNENSIEHDKSNWKCCNCGLDMKGSPTLFAIDQHICNDDMFHNIYRDMIPQNATWKYSNCPEVIK